MAVGTISIIAGLVLLVLLSLFFKDEEETDQKEGLHGVDRDGLSGTDASDDPGLAHLPGNSYHYSWSANHSDQE
ncbi:hypothetical protein [Desulforhopalus sp. IMCC35007]|uniref:hypothetical protein n=1 Tax=Desulforhopalus sp. IMCC35007 TaxID=2569543 RepID=UPI0010AE036B|nr:hypothetical protein [Desulforhopalus sp. IMCC35007]TKB08844.1 hypothetical protein FCL48_12525 [Desulforhopalus sp. IMCC35007]